MQFARLQILCITVFNRSLKANNKETNCVFFFFFDDWESVGGSVKKKETQTQSGKHCFII